MPVLVRHGLLFLYSSVFVRWCLAGGEGCKAEFIIKMRISGTGILWGRSGSLGRSRGAPVVPMLGWCWGDAELRYNILHYGILEISAGKATLTIFHLLLVLSCLFA